MPKADLDRCGHDDVRHGFVISFPDKEPEFDIQELEQKVLDMIRADLPITYVDNHHVSIGEHLHLCTGPRIHVTRTGDIKNFHLLRHFIYDRFGKRYLLVGSVGDNAMENLAKLDAQQMKQSDLIL